MWILTKEYWISRIHPTNVGFSIEDCIRWVTFGLYKPFITSTICGLLEEWKEVREHEASNTR